MYRKPWHEKAHKYDVLRPYRHPGKHTIYGATYKNHYHQASNFTIFLRAMDDLDHELKRKRTQESIKQLRGVSQEATARIRKGVKNVFAKARRKKTSF